jgi:hypothetical protein
MSETCGVFCNVVRLDPCPDCRLWRSYCLTHLRPTDANRCTCVRAPSPSAAPAHELWDGLFRDEIQCPHCHAVDYEHTDYPSGLRHDGDTAESGCAFCDKPMRVTLCAAYTYATEPLPAPASPRPEESEKTECPHGIDTLKTCGACPDAAPSPGATAPLTEERLAEWERIVHEWVPDDPDSRDRKVLALIAEVRRLRADEEGRTDRLLRLADDAERQSKLNPPAFGDPIAVAGPWAWARMATLIREALGSLAGKETSHG